MFHAAILEGVDSGHFRTARDTEVFRCFAALGNERQPAQRPKHEKHAPAGRPRFPARSRRHARSRFLVAIRALGHHHRSARYDKVVVPVASPRRRRFRSGCAALSSTAGIRPCSCSRYATSTPAAGVLTLQWFQGSGGFDWCSWNRGIGNKGCYRQRFDRFRSDVHSLGGIFLFLSEEAHRLKVCTVLICQISITRTARRLDSFRWFNALE
mmetsp:Transcript_23195/g.54849  ORF Transcript_23195/g.54849 Transcript_23195/m.54849 type:complete len:211 (+) Transcript_23195:324-956(+)